MLLCRWFGFGLVFNNLLVGVENGFNFLIWGWWWWWLCSECMYLGILFICCEFVVCGYWLIFEVVDIFCVKVFVCKGFILFWVIVLEFGIWDIIFCFFCIVVNNFGFLIFCFWFCLYSCIIKLRWVLGFDVVLLILEGLDVVFIFVVFVVCFIFFVVVGVIVVVIFIVVVGCGEVVVGLIVVDIGICGGVLVWNGINKFIFFGLMVVVGGIGVVVGWFVVVLGFVVVIGFVVVCLIFGICWINGWLDWVGLFLLIIRYLGFIIFGLNICFFFIGIWIVCICLILFVMNLWVCGMLFCLVLNICWIWFNFFFLFWIELMVGIFVCNFEFIFCLYWFWCNWWFFISKLLGKLGCWKFFWNWDVFDVCFFLNCVMGLKKFWFLIGEMFWLGGIWFLVGEVFWLGDIWFLVGKVFWLGGICWCFCSIWIFLVWFCWNFCMFWLGCVFCKFVFGNCVGGSCCFGWMVLVCCGGMD